MGFNFFIPSFTIIGSCLRKEWISAQFHKHQQKRIEILCGKNKQFSSCIHFAGIFLHTRLSKWGKRDECLAKYLCVYESEYLFRVNFSVPGGLWSLRCDRAVSQPIKIQKWLINIFFLLLLQLCFCSFFYHVTTLRGCQTFHFYFGCSIPFA